MRSLAIVCGLLLAACSTTSPARPEEAPKASFYFADLDLQKSTDRRTLVSRVDIAAADYCSSHSAIVTPYHRRAEPRYCLDTIRVQLLWAMPPEVRRAYNSARAGRPTD